ncbi:MAG: MerR family DNA-binding transcriptional regulator [Streptosporangiales bacterium]|nr:MerR family DNA-binding transcriptional regulator [Streptosporangiales bacterium]
MRTFKSPRNPEVTLRPVDLARAAGISTQQVRNYEDAGLLPPTERTPSGYRRYVARHRHALLTYRALMRGHGIERARAIMLAVHRGDVPAALAVIDAGHADLHEQRRNLRATSEALETVAAQEVDGDRPPDGGEGRDGGSGGRPSGDGGARGGLAIGDVAGRLGVRPSALRVWEAAGLLRPGRDRVTGYRTYGAADLRDARMIDMLRRLHYPLPQIAPVMHGLRREGSSEALRAAIARRQDELTARATAMLEASALLHTYLADGKKDRTATAGGRG